MDTVLRPMSRKSKGKATKTGCSKEISSWAPVWLFQRSLHIIPNGHRSSDRRAVRHFAVPELEDSPVVRQVDARRGVADQIEKLKNRDQTRWEFRPVFLAELFERFRLPKDQADDLRQLDVRTQTV